MRELNIHRQGLFLTITESPSTDYYSSDSLYVSTGPSITRFPINAIAVKPDTHPVNQSIINLYGIAVLDQLRDFINSTAQSRIITTQTSPQPISYEEELDECLYRHFN